MSGVLASAVVLAAQALVLALPWLIGALRPGHRMLYGALAGFAAVALLTLAPVTRPAPGLDAAGAASTAGACRQILRLAGEAGLLGKDAAGGPVLQRARSGQVPERVWATLQACLEETGGAAPPAPRTGGDLPAPAPPLQRIP